MLTEMDLVFFFNSEGKDHRTAIQILLHESHRIIEFEKSALKIIQKKVAFLKITAVIDERTKKSTHSLQLIIDYLQ